MCIPGKRIKLNTEMCACVRVCVGWDAATVLAGTETYPNQDFPYSTTETEAIIENKKI